MFIFLTDYHVVLSYLSIRLRVTVVYSLKGG